MILKTINTKKDIYIVPSSYTVGEDLWLGSDVYITDDECTIEIATDDFKTIEYLNTFDGSVSIMNQNQFDKFIETFEEDDRAMESYIILKDFEGPINLVAYEEHLSDPIKQDFDLENELAMYQDFGVDEYELAIVIPKDAKYIIMDNKGDAEELGHFEPTVSRFINQ